MRPGWLPRPGSLDKVNVVDPDVRHQGRACVRHDVPLGLPVDAVDLGGDPLSLLVTPARVDGDAVGRGYAAIAAGIQHHRELLPAGREVQIVSVAVVALRSIAAAAVTYLAARVGIRIGQLHLDC